MVRPSPDPTMSMYAFMAYYLRFLRQAHNLRQPDVGEIIGCSVSQVSKYESGEKHLDENQCAALDRAWNTGGLFTIMLGYAKLGTDTTWPERLRRYQRKAVVHKIFSANVIPIPFQTEDYARGLLEAGYAAGGVTDVDKVLDQRMARQQEILDSQPQIWVVVDEAALRPMGTPAVMSGQRDRLLELMRLRNVSVRILPDATMPHIGVNGSFISFTLPDRRLAAFSGSALNAGRVVDDQTEAAGVADRFDRLAARAWSEDQSCERIERIGREHEGMA